MQYIYAGESVIVKSTVSDIRKSKIDFHGRKETLMHVLHDIGFSSGKFDNR
jgi:hypothetical protein